MAEVNGLWSWLLAAIAADQPVALLIVVESRGSTPAKAGAKMAVTATASIGTLGGGLIEAEMLAMARSLLQASAPLPQQVRRVHYPGGGRVASGMICGGEQTLVLYPCKPSDRPVIEALLAHAQAQGPLHWQVSAQGLALAAISLGVRCEYRAGDDWCYWERQGCQRRAFIIGAGHVGWALSQLLQTLGFDITLLDERQALETEPKAVCFRQLAGVNYARIGNYLTEGPEVFVFVMTHRHQSDELVLRQLGDKKLAYLGLLGSRHKVAQIKCRLNAVWTDQQLQRLHAPMGLPIHSHTPEEIAISIAAEVVQILNQS